MCETGCVWVLLAAAVLSVVMALGAHGYFYSLVVRRSCRNWDSSALSHQVPVVGEAVLVPIPLLAAYGVSWFQSAHGKMRKRERVTLLEH